MNRPVTPNMPKNSSRKTLLPDVEGFLSTATMNRMGDEASDPHPHPPMTMQLTAFLTSYLEKERYVDPRWQRSQIQRSNIFVVEVLFL